MFNLSLFSKQNTFMSLNNFITQRKIHPSLLKNIADGAFCFRSNYTPPGSRNLRDEWRKRALRWNGAICYCVGVREIGDVRFERNVKWVKSPNKRWAAESALQMLTRAWYGNGVVSSDGRGKSCLEWVYLSLVW